MQILNRHRWISHACADDSLVSHLYGSSACFFLGQFCVFPIHSTSLMLSTYLSSSHHKFDSPSNICRLFFVYSMMEGNMFSNSVAILLLLLLLLCLIWICEYYSSFIDIYCEWVRERWILNEKRKWKVLRIPHAACDNMKISLIFLHN